jgi:hypothetical protein
MTKKKPPSDVAVPPIPQALLAHLELVFPDRSPVVGEDIKTIRHKAGQVSVVRYLRAHYDAQSTTVLASQNKCVS